MKTDIEIALSQEKSNITDIAKKIGLSEDEIETYGKYKCKIDLSIVGKKDIGDLVLVTAMTPTKFGEGKTTVTVGLLDGLNKIGVKTIAALREPSLGPVFGVKGGACGGGYAQVLPMEDINLHFTGDFHAITSANNLICAVIDNHIYQGNELNIDTKKILIKRAVDMNDRQLRNIVSGLGKKTDGVVREDGFDITVATELMAVFCLARDFKDLKNKISEMVVAYNRDGEFITVSDLNIVGSVCVLLKDAIKPNLVQTIEKNPVIMHGGPFANIAHGCNSIIATKMAMKLADLVVTEAGFGADLGAEKFLDIKCRMGNLKPKLAVVVATIRALKYHGGLNPDLLKDENMGCLNKGLDNLIQHINNLKNEYGLDVIVAINKFPTDKDNELKFVEDKCMEFNTIAKVITSFENGGDGAIELAYEVKKLIDNGKSDFKYLYEDSMPIRDKILKLVKNIYHGEAYTLTKQAENNIKQIENSKYKNLPICVAKTQYSFSDNEKLLNAPKGFTVTIRDVKISAGARFIVLYLGEIMTMPGLPKHPAAYDIDIDENYNIKGLF